MVARVMHQEHLQWVGKATKCKNRKWVARLCYSRKIVSIRVTATCNAVRRLFGYLKTGTIRIKSCIAEYVDDAEDAADGLMMRTIIKMMRAMIQVIRVKRGTVRCKLKNAFGCCTTQGRSCHDT